MSVAFILYETEQDNSNINRQLINFACSSCDYHFGLYLRDAFIFCSVANTINCVHFDWFIHHEFSNQIQTNWRFFVCFGEHQFLYLIEIKRELSLFRMQIVNNEAEFIRSIERQMIRLSMSQQLSL